MNRPIAPTGAVGAARLGCPGSPAAHGAQDTGPCSAREAAKAAPRKRPCRDRRTVSPEGVIYLICSSYYVAIQPTYSVYTDISGCSFGFHLN